MSITPVPVRDKLQLSFTLQKSGAVTVELFTIDGRIVGMPIQDREYTSGRHVENVAIEGLAAGNYTLRLNTNAGSRVERFVVVR
jgi:hypothetical protein